MNDYWHKHHGKKTWRSNFVVFLLIVISLFSGMTIGSLFGHDTGVATEQAGEAKVEVTGNVVSVKPLIYDNLDDSNVSSFAYINIPAIDEDDNGITTTMFVQVFPGSGRVLTNIDRLLFWVDTQNSIRRATQVAENVTGLSLIDYDIVYTIEANATVIGGPSAGAAITMATIAALLNKTINESVMITGSVNHDGTIGPVGAILEKAVVSKESGAVMFLVPMTQSTEVTYKTREYCEKVGWVDFCTTETYPVKVDIEEDADILVEEVMDIKQAMEYMLV